MASYRRKIIENDFVIFCNVVLSSLNQLFIETSFMFFFSVILHIFQVKKGQILYLHSVLVLKMLHQIFCQLSCSLAHEVTNQFATINFKTDSSQHSSNDCKN